MPWAQRFCRSCRIRIPKGTRCDECARDYEEQRGTKADRGYGRDYQAERKRWAPIVATGTVTCWRCGQLITATEPWDQGHDDNDRTVIRGPEHAYRCNRAAAGRSAHH